MAESFENLGTILHEWAEDKVQKSFVDALKRYKKQKKNNKAVFLENDSEKLLEQSQSVIEQDY